MSGHNDAEEKDRWKRAAQMEGISVAEFKKRAANDRADKILDPFKGVVSGLAKGLVGALIRELPAAQEKICVCGHSQRDHLGISSGSKNGSCGRATCDCRKFSEGRSPDVRR